MMGKVTASLVLLLAMVLVGSGISTDYAEARSMKGGRSFRMMPQKAPAQTVRPAPGTKKTDFRRGLAGGLLGGALGGLLFGSLFGMGGQGMGILPILLLAAAAYFLFRRMSSSRQQGYSANQAFGGGVTPTQMFGGGASTAAQPPPVPPGTIGSGLVAEGLAQIRQHDPGFDENYFLEVASDVFFQIQAGWMRRDIDAYRHLLGEQLAREYEQHFQMMREKGHINKLESIAVREVEIVEAGSDGREDFMSIRFTASLLDYTVDDQSGELIEGSMTNPVKFEEKWTWARPVGSEGWKLEGIAEG